MSKNKRIIILLLLIVILVACTKGASFTKKEENVRVETATSEAVKNEKTDVPTAESLTEKGTEVVEETKVTEVIEATEVTEEADKTEATQVTAEPQVGYALNKKITITETLIYDQDGIKITAKSLDFSGWLGPELKLLAENDSGRSITIQANDVVINDFMVDTIMSADVAAGKKINDELTIMSSSLKTAQIEMIQYIELAFRIIDSEDYSKSITTDRIRVETDADASYVQPVDDSGTLMVERDGIKIVMKQLITEESFWGADLFVLIENNSGKNISVQVRDVSINGFMIDALFHADVLDGTKAFDEISILESDLEENDIQEINEIELYFHIFDKESWSNIFDTEVIKVTFD